MEFREFEQTIIAIRFSDERQASNDQTLPFGIITIDVDGNMYTFSPELAGFENFAVGNIFEKDFPELASSPNLRRMVTEIQAGTELCQRDCEYFSVCGGDAPANKIFENGTFRSTETTFCRLSKKRITDFVLEAIETALLDPDARSRYSFNSNYLGER
jgi:uncharacterized protein